MTPLINEFIADIYREAEGRLDPTDLMWFDASDVITEKVSVSSEILETPLPFEYTAFVCQTVVNPTHKVLIMLSNNPPIKVNGTVCHAWVKDPRTNATNRLIDFYYRVEDGEVVTTLFETEKGNKIVELTDDEINDKDREVNQTTVALIALFLDSLNRGTKYYAPTKRANHVKRLRQGKVPMFDWRTVVIEPSKPKREHQGGTHASPRLHDRRGHWRVMKSGKKVWVKNCKVGDPSRGVIFHDYAMKDAA